MHRDKNAGGSLLVVPAVLSNPLVVLAAFLVLTIPIVLFGRWEHSGWILTTAPYDSAYRINPLLGWATLLEGRPFHLENETTLFQDSLFRGAKLASVPFYDKYFYRPLFAFLTSLFSPLTGFIVAATLVNYACWAAAALVTWRFANELFEDKVAAFIAVFFASTGLGWIIHIGDYGSHLISFVFYYVGIYLVWRIRLWEDPKPVETHVLMACFTALFTLAYTTGVVFGIAYCILALRGRSRLRHIFVFCFITFCALPIWQLLLQAAITFNTGAPQSVALFSAERSFLFESLVVWFSSLAEPWQFLKLLGRKFSEFLFFCDSPLVIVFGWYAVSRAISERKIDPIFFSVLFFLPILAGLPFANAGEGNTVRGYLVYGTTLLLIVPLAGWLSSLFRGPSARPLAATILLLMIALSHIGWNASHFFGYFAPIKTYLIGWPLGLEIAGVVADVMSLTGLEPTPANMGGHATMQEAGAIMTGNERVFEFTLFGLVLRAFFAGCIALLVCAACYRTRARVPATAGAFLLCLAPIAWSAGKPVRQIAATATGFMIQMKPHDRLDYEVALSSQFRAKLESEMRANPESSLEVLIPSAWYDLSRVTELTVQLGDASLVPGQCRLRHHLLICPSGPFLAAIPNAEKLKISIANGASQLPLMGWQHAGLPGRKMNPAESPAVLGAEIRLRRTSGALLLAGF